MKALALLMTLAATTTMAQDVQKDVLTCSFTEPFITITYDAATGRITKNGPEQWSEKEQKYLPLEIAKNGKLVTTKKDQFGYETSFKLLDDKGSVILEANLNFDGSDGMSDLVYPFSSVYDGSLHGGCETKAAPAVDIVNLNYSLKR